MRVKKGEEWREDEIESSPKNEIRREFMKYKINSFKSPLRHPMVS